MTSTVPTSDAQGSTVRSTSASEIMSVMHATLRLVDELR
jgi:hypothetical protein